MYNTVVDVGFDQLLYTVSEADTSVDVCVNLAGELEREVRVELLTLDSVDTNATDNILAMAGIDYVSFSTNLTFTEAGRMCGSVQLIQDLTLESSEMFFMTLATDDGAINFSSALSEVILLDSDRE